LIDTAEMYGDGRSEQLVGEAIAGRRKDVFLVSKVLPHHATRNGIPKACHASLERLGTDCIDLYLLHWPGRVPLAETVDAFSRLCRDGKIRYWGVSNFDSNDMQKLATVAGGDAVATNQLLYNLSRRGIEWDLIPNLRKRRIPVMAYSPIEQARLLTHSKLLAFGEANALTPAQAALGWLLAKDDVIVIPRTARHERMRENLDVLDRPLNAAQVAELDSIFPPPSASRPLETL